MSRSLSPAYETMTAPGETATLFERVREKKNLLVETPDR